MNNDKMQRAPRFRRHGSIFMTVAVCVAAFGVAAAAGAVLSKDKRASRAEYVEAESGKKDWTVIGRGHDARAGDYVLYRADAGGKECVGVRLIDHEPPGIPGAIANICDVDPGLDAAFLQGRGFSFAYGRASDSAASITLNDGDGSHGAVIRRAAGKSGKYFVVGGRGHKVSVQAKDASGGVLATRDAGDQ